MNQNGTDVIAEPAGPAKAKPRRRAKRGELEFNVIVTFCARRSILAMFDGDRQIIFDVTISHSNAATYDDVMRELLEAIFEIIDHHHALGPHDVEWISTAANWSGWKELTGFDYGKSASESELAPYGKFHF